MGHPCVTGLEKFSGARGCNSVVDCLLSICKVLNVNTSAMQKGKQNSQLPPQKKTSQAENKIQKKPKTEHLWQGEQTGLSQF